MRSREERETVVKTYQETGNYLETSRRLNIPEPSVRYYVKKAARAQQRVNPMLAPIPAVNTGKVNAGFQTNGPTYGMLGITIPQGVPANVEIGTPGLKHWFGRIAEEFIRDLNDECGRRTYQEMAWNDSTIAAILFAIEMLIRNAPWYAQPVDESDDEVERAEFLETCFHDMYVTWTETLSEMLSVCIHGFELNEIVFKQRKGIHGELASDFDDGKWGIHKLAPRSQESIFRWIIDDKGEILGIVQWAPPLYEQRVIGYEKLLHLKTRGYRHSPEGISLLRGAFRPWTIKKGVEDLEAVGIERDLCGVPLIQISDEIMAAAAGNDDDAVKAKALVASMQTLATHVKRNEQSGIVFPLGYDENGNELYKFSLISSPGSRLINTSEVIARLDRQIATTVCADFLLLGLEKVGSFSLASSKTDIFSLIVAGVMDTISEPINRKLVPMLFEANGEKGPYPKWTHGDIETPDLQALGGFVTAMTNAGHDLTDDATARYLRQVANLPVDVEG